VAAYITESEAVERSKLHRQALNMADVIEGRQSRLERARSQQELVTVLQRIRAIDAQKQLKEYTDQTHDILVKHANIKPTSTTIVIGRSTGSQRRISPELSSRLMNLIGRYIEVVSEIIPTSVRLLDWKTQCMGCSYQIDSDVDVSISGIITCPGCGAQIPTFTSSYAKEEDPKVGLAVMAMGDTDYIKNIRLVITNYQGKQNVKLPEDLEELLDQHFCDSKIPIGSEIATLPLDEEGHRGKTTFVMMLRALDAIGYARHYKNAHLICANYWGWRIPDISTLESSILDDCNAIKPIFDQNKNGRKSNLGYWYLLWRCLLRHGHRVSPDDFKIVTTDKILEWYESMWSLFCRELDWAEPESIDKVRMSFRLKRLKRAQSNR